jgi:uncharacterized membrane protein
MDDRITKYIDILRTNLADLPEAERNGALAYYEEYISDALDEGIGPDELLARLDPPEQAAQTIKAETSIRRIHDEPRLKNYSKLVGYARIGITRPLSVSMFSLLIFTTYSIAAILFLGAVISAAAACIILPALVYEALRIPSAYLGEIIGTIGFGIFAAGIFILISYGFYVLCRPLIRLSANLIYRMMKKGSKRSNMADYKKEASDTEGRPKPARRPLKAGLAIIAAGLAITLVSGLPVKLFLIFNSMKPAGITTHRQEFSIGEVQRLSITTTHSIIRLTEGSSDKIMVEYEQSDWLDFDMTCQDGVLVFTEKSNGRLPLFPLVSMHENRAGLTVELPVGYRPDGVSLESRGGFIYIDGAGFPVDAKTYTGLISLTVSQEAGDDSALPSVRAETSSGVIFLHGETAGHKSQNGTIYGPLSESSAEIRLESERGSIFIE